MYFTNSLELANQTLVTLGLPKTRIKGSPDCRITSCHYAVISFADILLSCDVIISEKGKQYSRQLQFPSHHMIRKIVEPNLG